MPIAIACLLALFNLHARGACLGVDEVARSQPNILLIVTDDMGYGDLGCYGSKRIATPAIDALARTGIRMTQGYVTAPVCAPSRAGLMTGRMQNRVGFEHNLASPKHVKSEHIGLPLTERTMGDRLQALGYRTALIGKWHLGKGTAAHHPNQRGFEHFFGMLDGQHDYFPTAKKNKLDRNGKAVTSIRTPYLTDWFTLDAIDFVRAKHGDAPWFLCLSYNTPHTPLQAQEQDIREFTDVKGKQRRTYCAMQRSLDRNVGQLLLALRATGQLESTLIVFVNDNGGSCDASHAVNAPLRGQKSTMLEGGLRVPFLVRWGAGLPQGRVFEHPVSTADLVPTFVAAAGGKMEAEWVGKGRRKKRKIYDGVDLLPFLRGKAEREHPHDRLCWRVSLRGAAIREGNLKLVRLPHRAPMLFDVVKDPSELDDLAAKQADRVAAMLRSLHDWECSFEANPIWVSANSWASYNRKLYERT